MEPILVISPGDLFQAPSLGIFDQGLQIFHILCYLTHSVKGRISPNQAAYLRLMSVVPMGIDKNWETGRIYPHVELIKRP